MDAKPDIQINIIVAAEISRGIGLNGTLPWKLPQETDYYHGMINDVRSPDAQNACIVGRVTFESIHDPKDYERLLKVVITRKSMPVSTDSNLKFVGTFNEAVEYLGAERTRRKIDSIWCLGGAGIYADTLNSPQLHRIYLTKVLQSFNCDTYFPEFDASLFQQIRDERVPSEVQHDNGTDFKVEVYEKL